MKENIFGHLVTFPWCTWNGPAHQQDKGMGEFDQEDLLDKYPLHLALLHCGYSSSELLTPSFPRISMV